MAYKKYIKKKGKVYGPYIYHSKRVGNKVVSQYVGKHQEEKRSLVHVAPFVKRNFLSLLLVFISLLVIFLLIRFTLQPTGRAFLEISEIVSQKQVHGFLYLNLKEGELIPADTKIRVSLGGQNASFSLFELLEERATEGNFFVENTTVSGTGQGYGFSGSKEAYPEIFFTMVLEPFEKEKEENKELLPESENGSSTEQPLSEENPEEPPASSESPVPKSSVGQPLPGGRIEDPAAIPSLPSETSQEAPSSELISPPGGSPLTGSVVQEDLLVEGSVSALKNFTYSLDGLAFKRFEHVRTADQEISQQDLGVEETAGSLVVFTTYSEKKEGFGEEFLGPLRKLKISLDVFNITADDGLLDIALVYGDAVLVEASKEIAAEKDILILNETNMSEAPEEIANVSKMNLSENFTLPLPEINATSLNGTEINISENATIIEQPVIGKPVKWVKKLRVEYEERVELPKEAEDITVKKGPQGSILTGQVVGGANGYGVSLRAFLKQITRFFTGRAVEEIPAEVEEDSDSKDVVLKEPADYEIKYSTPAPEAREEIISLSKKRVVVSGPDLGYENILTFASLPYPLPVEKEPAVRVYWVEEGRDVDSVVLDRDGDGLLDEVQWITPHLSNQTFEISIVILNVQSYPTVGGNWTVLFNTTGAADLRVYASNGTNWTNFSEEGHDLKFLELNCGDSFVETEFVNESADCGTGICYALARNYSCNDTGFEISKVLTSGKHTLRFEFGNETAYAHNLACGDISTCGSLDVPNCVYNLVQNVSSPGTCFTVTANNITFNGNGYNVTYGTSGTVGSGVEILGANTTTIKNISVLEGNSAGPSKPAFYFAFSFNSSLRDVLIETTGAGSFGVQIDASSGLLVTSTFVNTSGYGSKGIYLYPLSTGATITNTSIFTIGGEANGIEIWYGSSLTQIINTTIITTGFASRGILIDYSFDVNLTYNHIFTSGGLASGIEARAAANNIFIAHNNITALNSNSLYLHQGVINGIVVNNTLTTSVGSGIGIEDRVYGFRFANSTLFAQGGNGITFDSGGVPITSNNTFSGFSVIVGGTSGYGIFLDSSQGSPLHSFSFYDSIINTSSSSGFDLFISNNVSGGEWNFTNVTRANGTIFTRMRSPGANGTLNVHWHADAFVNYTNGSIASNVALRAYNRSGTLAFTAVTDATGRILQQTVLEFRETNTTLGGSKIFAYHSNYTFNATHPTENFNRTQSWNMTLNRLLVFTLRTPECVDLDNPDSLSGSSVHEVMSGGIPDYYLNGNVTLCTKSYLKNDQSGLNGVLIFNRSHIELNGNGSFLNKSGSLGLGLGVVATNLTNITVTNLSLVDFGTGVFLNNISNATLSYLFLNSSYGQFGINIKNSTNITLTHVNMTGIAIGNDQGGNCVKTYTSMYIAVRSSFFYQCNDSAIFFEKSNYTTVQSVVISKAYNSNGALRYVDSLFNFVEHTNISNTTRGIVMDCDITREGDSSFTHLFVNNSDQIGIQFRQGCDNVTLVDSMVFDSGTGIEVHANVTLYNTTSWYSNPNIRFVSSSPSQVPEPSFIVFAYDSDFNDTLPQNDVLFSAPSTNTINVTFVNSTFGTFSLSGSPGLQQLAVQWRLDAEVNNTSGQPILGANISALDTTSALRFSELTDASGLMPQRNLTEFIYTKLNGSTSVSKNVFNNYTLNVASPAYRSQLRSINVTSSRFEVFFLSLNNATECFNATESNLVYYLVGDLASSGTCITIQADNITIDGQGFLINYSASDAGYGIFVQGRRNTTLRNLRIEEASQAGSGDSGVYIEQGANVTLMNTTIVTYSPSSFGIQLSGSGIPAYYQASVIGNMITTFGSSAAGINILDRKSDVLANNSIVTNGSGAQGIFFQSSTDSTVAGNSINSSGTGIQFQTNSHNNFLQRNVITSFGNGIYIEQSKNILLFNQVIRSFANNGAALFFYFDAANISVFNTTLTASGSTLGRGIYLHTRSSNNTFFNTTITTGGNDNGYGIQFAVDSSNNSFIHTVILTNNLGGGGHGIRFESSSVLNMFSDLSVTTLATGSSAVDILDGNHNFTIRDGVLNATQAGDADFLVESGVAGQGEWNFTNITFTDSSRAAGAEGTLHVHWYLDVNVTNVLGEPVVGALVNITDTFGNSRMNETDIFGLIERQILIEYSENRTTKTFYTNYTLNVTSARHAPKTVSSNLTNNTYLVVVLNQFPDITQHFPISGEKVLTPGSALLNYSLNDVDNDTMEVFVFGSNDSSLLANAILYHKKNVSNGNFIYNFTGKVVPENTPEVVALYHFDNLSDRGENGILALDFSFPENNAVVQNGSWNETAKFFGGYMLDGRESFHNISIADSNDFDMPDYTVAGWFFMAGNGSGTSSGTFTNVFPLLSKCRAEVDTTVADMIFFVGVNASDLRLVADFENGTSATPNNNPLGGVIPLRFNEWHHFALVAKNQSYASLYLDGVLEFNRSIAATPNLGSVCKVGIGQTYNSAGVVDGAFNGTLDEIVIFNRTLSPLEVKELAQLTPGRYSWKVNASTSSGLSSAETFFIIPDLPFTSQIVLNSTFGTNFSSEDLFCYANAIDDPAPSEYLTAYWKWYRGNSLIFQGLTDMRTEVALDQNMVFLFHFNNNSAAGENNTHVYDSSGRGHNATCSPSTEGPCPNFTSQGYFGGAFNYTYTGPDTASCAGLPQPQENNTHFRIKDNLNISLGPNMTLAAWVYLANNTGFPNDDHEILTHTRIAGSTVGYTFGVTDDTCPGGASCGRLRFDYKDSGGGSRDHYGKSIVQPYQWHYVVLMRKDNRILFYLDGSNDGDLPFTSGPDNPLGIIDPVTDLWIGESGGQECNEGWNGYIDELAFWNRSLSNTEILNLYKRGKGVEILKNITRLDSSFTLSGEWWNCSLFVSNQRKNESIDNNATLFTLNDFPQISFDPPTLPNATVIQTDFAEINASISDFLGPRPGIGNVLFNWNGTNFSLYDSTLFFMFNFDNRSSLGENDAFVRDLGTKGMNLTFTGPAASSEITNNSRFSGGIRSGFSQNTIWNGGDVDVLNNITITAWVNMSGTDLALGSQVIITKSSGCTMGTGEWYFAVRESDGLLRFNCAGTLSGVTGVNISKDQWNFVAVTFNENTDTLTLYANGMSGSVSNTNSCLVDGADLIHVGDFSGCAPGELNGTFDELRVWNRILNAGEIREAYYSHLYRHNQTQWYLYVNQSNITDGIYPYFAAVRDLDGNLNMTETRLLRRGNHLPNVVTLDSPSDEFTTTNRTPSFTWISGGDPDGDALTYVFNISCFHVSGGACSDDNRNFSVSGTETQLANYLKYLGDDNYYYNWTVRAFDGFEYGPWAIARKLFIQSLVQTSLNPATVDFGILGVGQTDDTTDDSPLSFVLQNDGNIFVNVSVNASSLFISAPMNTSFYQYKIRLHEPNSFDLGRSFLSFTNASLIPVPSLFLLNWRDSSDTAKIDIRVTVPQQEPVGSRLSTMIFIASRASTNGSSG